MTHDQYTPIYTREQGEAYLAGWRDRRELGQDWRGNSAWIMRYPPNTDREYFRRGFYEACAAINLGRNIGQNVGNLPH